MISKIEQLVYVVLGVGVVVLIALPFMPKLPSSWGGRPCAAVALAPDREVAGALSPAGCRLSQALPGQTDNSVCALYSLTLAAPSLVTIDLRSTDFDAHLTLLDARRTPIATDDDGGEARNARIVRPLEAGAYLILAKALGGGHGRFTVRAGLTPGGPGGGSPPGGGTARVCPLADLPLNQPVSARLDASDCRVNQILGGGTDQAYADQYRLTVPARGTLTIDMRSDDVDSFLILMDSSRNPLARDDDGGEGRNSRITQTVAPGTYIVIANSYGGQSQGAYTLQAAFAP